VEVVQCVLVFHRGAGYGRRRHLRSRGSRTPRSVGRGGALAPISSKRPAYRKSGIKAVRARVAKVRGAQETAITSQIVHLMLRGAQLKVSGQLKSDSNRAVVSDGFH